MRIPRFGRFVVSALLGFLVAIGGFGSRIVVGSTVDRSDLVFVTDDAAVYINGCDAISAFRVSTGEVLLRGRTDISPGRLAATKDLGTVLALNSNSQSDGGPFIVGARRINNSAKWSDWGHLAGADFAQVGGIGISDDDGWLVASTVGKRAEDSIGYDRLTHPPPFGAGSWQLAEISDDGQGSLALGPIQGYIQTDAPVAVVIMARDGVAHLVTDEMVVETVRVDTMERIAPDIQLAPFGNGRREPHAQIGGIYATISNDGRYLIVNRGDATPPSLAVADLAYRTASLLVAPTGIEYTGDVSFDHEGPGLLALHASDVVVVMKADLPSRLDEASRASVIRDISTYSNRYGPRPSVAWAGGGQYVIAAEFQRDSEFAVFQFDNASSRLSRSHSLDSCADTVPGLPNDILTASELYAPPWPGVVAPTATDTPEPTSVEWPPVPTTTEGTETTSTPTAPTTPIRSPMPTTATPSSGTPARPLFIPSSFA